MCVFDESLSLDTQRRIGLAHMGIDVLSQNDKDNIWTALYGR